MTHKDIYTKFMIEYDKANVTSSYPSLTEYEVATVLDKAYYALIAQKLTGNNIRKVPFEADVKSVEDLRPLLVLEYTSFNLTDGIVSNLAKASLPENSLYLMKVILSYIINEDKLTVVESINATSSKIFDLEELKDIPFVFVPTSTYDTIDMDKYVLKYSGSANKFVLYELYNGREGILRGPYIKTLPEVKRHILGNLSFEGDVIIYPINEQMDATYTLTLYKADEIINTPLDDKINRSLPAKQVSHDMAEKFYASAYNLPWIKQPVFYLEDDSIFVVFDPIKRPNLSETSVIYIKKPNAFVKSNLTVKENEQDRTYFQVKGKDGSDITANIPEYQFECNDSVAEELISLAISFALENIESPRLNTKLNMRGLEA